MSDNIESWVNDLHASGRGGYIMLNVHTELVSKYTGTKKEACFPNVYKPRLLMQVTSLTRNVKTRASVGKYVAIKQRTNSPSVLCMRL